MILDGYSALEATSNTEDEEGVVSEKNNFSLFC